jgi:hypothetical protein
MCRWGVYLEKLEKKLLVQRFAGPRIHTVEYEPLIFWAASGLDMRRIRRKLTTLMR